MRQTRLLLCAIFVFPISTQYPHYDQITTELHPEYMHMTGNQLDDALKILMISQQNSKKQQQMIDYVNSKQPKAAQHKMDVSLLKQSRQSAFTTLLGKQSSVAPTAKNVQFDSRIPKESVYERLYSQGAVRKRLEPQHNNSMRPCTPKEIPVQLTEPTRSQ